MKRLAVFFPGVGYTPDKPLLYHSRRIAEALGFDILTLTFSGFPKKIKGDEKKMRKSFDLALSQSREQLKEAKCSAYDEIVFLGKSIGAVAAAALAAEISLRAPRALYAAGAGLLVPAAADHRLHRRKRPVGRPGPNPRTLRREGDSLHRRPGRQPLSGDRRPHARSRAAA